MSAATGLTITNPLFLYRNLVALGKLEADPTQHRLALHLQKLYYRLKDYDATQSSAAEYSRQIDRIARDAGRTPSSIADTSVRSQFQNRGFVSSLKTQKSNAEALALTKKLTHHESAVQLDSPKGILLYGEVGTGKSMMLDILANALPNRKKRRWHFNTFMLEVYARLDQYRKETASSTAAQSSISEEYALLRLARDMISSSPIMFLDEFQLPDRAASKILSNFLTSFFHLGGVMLASTNRMPEELAKAAGAEFTLPPATRLGLLGDRWGLLGESRDKSSSEALFGGQSDFSAFLEVLRARCDVWDMEGSRDWRRRDAEVDGASRPGTTEILSSDDGFESMATGNLGLGYEQSRHTRKTMKDTSSVASNDLASFLPRYYFLNTAAANEDNKNRAWESAVLLTVSTPSYTPASVATVPWAYTTLRVYGRTVPVSSSFAGVTKWTFPALCASNFGPADYITLASTFHTLILTEVPVLTILQKNEARRFITLLDALYEARCKVLIQAEASPDDLFFPKAKTTFSEENTDSAEDGTYAETFSEIYQDVTAPFRPNISSYQSSASPPDYETSPLPNTHQQRSAHSSVRSILADEDADFGPAYGAGRSWRAPSDTSHPDEPTDEFRTMRGQSDGAPGAGNEIGSTPRFAQTGAFTGEDEKFAYKRARSRLWEMCGRRWWDREGDWWQPVDQSVRRWEGSAADSPQPQQEVAAVAELEKLKDGEGDETIFRHGASPFRTHSDPPPKFNWMHAWGMMTWGKKAGKWGQGTKAFEPKEGNNGERD